ncbi:hypothetical protein GCM10010885_22020 [Alicyclobacillus cellulosilyticus]|uniref:Uncharacterized protein n=1 Tax=Alicyclobacillus cellulosilyticus TaxID=1003997 RepID=A0A917NMY7_9BACL|nr:hypothetical protein GCM10010885_22020 [Alicyclobacillus cellulosilyticus]
MLWAFTVAPDADGAAGAAEGAAKAVTHDMLRVSADAIAMYRLFISSLPDALPVQVYIARM